MKNEKIQFNIRKWNTGKYNVVTRDGRKARILCTELKNNPFPVVAAVNTPSGKRENITIYTEDGHFWPSTDENADLFLVEKKTLRVGDIVKDKYNNYYFVEEISNRENICLYNMTESEYLVCSIEYFHMINCKILTGDELETYKNSKEKTTIYV